MSQKWEFGCMDDENTHFEVVPLPIGKVLPEEGVCQDITFYETEESTGREITIIHS